MWLLIPAKSPTLAKSRLAPVLSDDARAVLARLLLARLLTTVSKVASIAGVVVISEDAGLRAIARLFGFGALPDPAGGLNAALEAGRDVALAKGATSLLVLPTDLPWLTRVALLRFLARAEVPGPRVVLAPDRHSTGTNALFLRPADALPFRFGRGSAYHHRRLAQQARLPLVEFHDPAFALDLDLPEDWARWVA